jgi:hypothetical protein
VRSWVDAKASAGEINRELAILKRMFTLAIKGNKLMVRPHIPMLRYAIVSESDLGRRPRKARSACDRDNRRDKIPIWQGAALQESVKY